MKELEKSQRKKNTFPFCLNFIDNKKIVSFMLLSAMFIMSFLIKRLIDISYLLFNPFMLDYKTI